MSGIAIGTKYDHLTLDERFCLHGLMEMGLAAGEIGVALAKKVAPSRSVSSRRRGLFDVLSDRNLTDLSNKARTNPIQISRPCWHSVYVDD